MTPAQSQAADHFWLGVIALLWLIVLVMLGLVCIWRLVWLVAEARQVRRPVSDDPQQEYADAANVPYFDEPYDWSASEWDAREAEVGRR